MPRECVVLTKGSTMGPIQPLNFAESAVGLGARRHVLPLVRAVGTLLAYSDHQYAFILSVPLVTLSVPSCVFAVPRFAF